MQRYRSVLAIVLAGIAALLVSCGSPTETVKGPTYTPAQIEQIQRFEADIQDMRDRMLEIPPLVQSGDWTDVQNFIHGPLGELRRMMSGLARNLSPEVQQDALQTARDVFDHLMLIDEAAKAQDVKKALRNYNGVLQDFDAFLKYIPSFDEEQPLAERSPAPVI